MPAKQVIDAPQAPMGLGLVRGIPSPGSTLAY